MRYDSYILGAVLCLYQQNGAKDKVAVMRNYDLEGGKGGGRSRGTAFSP